MTDKRSPSAPSRRNLIGEVPKVTFNDTPYDRNDNIGPNQFGWQNSSEYGNPEYSDDLIASSSKSFLAGSVWPLVMMWLLLAFLTAGTIASLILVTNTRSEVSELTEIVRTLRDQINCID